jgi:type II secretion system protein J
MCLTCAPCACSTLEHPRRPIPPFVGPPGRTAGFTLLEILVAVVILSIVILTAMSALSAANRTAAAITQNLATGGEARNAIEQITTDLMAMHLTQAALYRPPQAGQDPDPYRLRCRNTPEDPEDFPRLEFAARAHRPLVATDLPIKPGALAKVAYFVRRIDDGYALMRTDVPDLRADFDPPPAPAMVCQRVKALRFSFFDHEDAVHDQWDSDDRRWHYATPRAVEIRLEVQDGPAYLVRVALPVDRGPLSS